MYYTQNKSNLIEDFVCSACKFMKLGAIMQNLKNHVLKLRT